MTCFTVKLYLYISGSERRYLQMNSETSGYLHLVMKIEGNVLLNIAKKYFDKNVASSIFAVTVLSKN